MTGADLAAELRSAMDQFTAADRAILLKYGVNAHDMDRLCGTERIRIVCDGLYELDSAGTTAVITPVRIEQPLTPESADPQAFVRYGAIIDLLAWHPAAAGRWALRCGAAEWLGCIEPQYIDPPVAAIRRSPLTWFRAGCTGLVLLTRAPADQYRVLCWCRQLEAEDDVHRDELRRLLRRPFPVPRVISVRRQGHGRAA
jgi:hypothetical protein